MKRLIGFALLFAFLFAGIAAAQCNTSTIPDPRVWKDTYSAGATYATCDVVYYSGSAYTSQQSSNLNHQPDISGAYWSVLFTGGPIDIQSNTTRAGSYLILDYNNAWLRANAIGNVASVYGRTGAVAAQAGDYQASQVTNAVDATQSYNNPPWITGINWGKILGAPVFLVSSNNLSDVTNVATARTNLGLGSAAQLSSVSSVGAPGSNSNVPTEAAVRAAINAGGAVTSVFGRTGAVTAQTGDYTVAQITNAADTTGSYSNPSWITALAYAKITGVPSFEPALGNPSVSGYLLASTTGGSRSWVAPNTGTVTSLTLTGTSNQITVSSCTVTTSGTCTVSLPANLILPGKMTFATSTTSGASFNLSSGTAPTSPNNGDFWNVSGILQSFDGLGVRSYLTDNSSLAWAKITGAPSFENALTFNSPLSRSTNTISLNMWGSGTRPVGASALGVSGNCVQWSAAGIGDTGSPCGTGSGTGANALGFYVVNQATNAPANAINLGLLPTGLMKNTISGGVATQSTAVAGTDYEGPLGNPSSNGQVLASTTGGTRSWVNAGVGTVTSVTINGTSNQITVSGCSAITTSGTCNLSLPNNLILPGKLNLFAGSTSAASLNIAPGVAPTSPASGDFWNLGTSLQWHDGTAVRTLLTDNSSLAWGKIAGAPTFLTPANNLSDVASASTARTNLGLGTAATQASSAFEVPLTFSGFLNRTSNTITLPVFGSGSRPVVANALGVSGNCVQWSAVGIGDTGSPCGSGGSGANSLGSYWVSGSANAPANAVNIGLLTAGLVKIGVSAGVATPSTAVAGTDYQAPITTGTVDQYLNGTLGLTSRVNCIAAGGVLQYNTSTHAETCHTLASADIPNNAANTSGTAANVTGIVAEANGGTGANNTPGAAGHHLRSNGTHYVDSAILVADVPTLNQNTTGSAGSFTGSIAGDVTGTQGATVVGKVNGGAVPASAGCVGTNSSGQLIASSCTGTGASFPTCHAYTYTTGTLTVDFSTYTCAIVTASGANPTLAFTPPSSSAATPLTLALINDTTARTWTLPGTAKQIGIPSAVSSGVWNNGIVYDGTNFQGSGSNETPSLIRFTSERSDPGTGGCLGGGCLVSVTGDKFRFRSPADVVSAPTKVGGDVAVDTGVVSGLNAVPFCTGFTPTAGQAITYTTSSTPNPCWTATTPSGGGSSLAEAAISTYGTCNSGSAATLAAVNDSNSGNVGATVTGGGSIHVLAYCNGTNWIVSSATGLATGVTLTVPSLGTGSSPITQTWTVGTPGVTGNHLVQMDTSNPSLIIGGTTGAYGVAMTSVGTSSTVEVARYGSVGCTTDTGGSTAGHLALVGTGGTCLDSGQTSSSAIPITTRVVGVFRTTAAAGGVARVELTPAHFGTQVTGGSGVSTSTVASLPAASSNTNAFYIITDGVGNSDTTTGGGTFRVAAVSDGTRWVPVANYYKSTFTAEQFGAVGNNSTDDTAAIQACITAAGVSGGTCMLAAKTYKLTSGVLSITTANTSLIGQGQRASILNFTSTTGDLVTVDMGGSGNCNSGIGFNQIKNLAIRRTAIATAGSGINLIHGCWTDIEDVDSWDSVSNFHVALSADTYIKRSQAFWQSSTSLTAYGFEIDSTSTGSNATTDIQKAAVKNSGTNKTAYYVHGASIADLNMVDILANSTDKGLVITSTGAGCGSCNTDVHFSGLVFDNLGTIGVQVNNVITGAGGLADINIGKSYIGVTGASGIGLDIESSQGVNFVNSHMRVTGTGGIGIKINGSSSANNLITSDTVRLSATAIQIAGSAFGNTITGNQFYRYTTAGMDLAAGASNTIVGNVFNASAGVVALSVASGSTLNSITGNSVDGTNTTGFNIAGNNNKLFGNVCDSSTTTTCLTNTGSGNLVDGSSGLSSALTSGHLFVGNGSGVATDVAMSGDGSMSNTGALTVAQLNGSNFTVNTSGVPTKVAGITTAGLGVSPIVAFQSLTNSSATSAVTLATAPGAGDYQIHYGLDVHTACTTGSESLSLSFGWTGNSARTLGTGGLVIGTAQATSSYLSGVIPIHIGSGNVTFTPTLSGACATGTATWDGKIWMTVN